MSDKDPFPWLSDDELVPTGSLATNAPNPLFEGVHLLRLKALLATVDSDAPIDKLVLEHFEQRGFTAGEGLEIIVIDGKECLINPSTREITPLNTERDGN